MDSDEKSLSPPSDISSPHSSSANTSTPSIPSSSPLLFSSSHEKNILIIQSLIQYSEYLKEICSDPQFPLASSPTIPILQSLEKYLFTLVHGSETFLLCETLKELRQNIYHSTSMVRAQSFHTPVQHSLQRQSSDEELRAPQTTCETSEGEDHVILSPIPYHISSFAFETPPQSPISPTLEDTGCLPSTPSSLRNFEMNSFLATSLSDDDNGISPQRSEGYGSTKDENCVEGLEEDDAEQSDDEKGKKNKRLNKSATAQLTKWLLDHLGR